MKNQNQRAFTLIELLIVVAIIAILAAIAVPNFLEAQTRAKVARVKADMRTLTTALESYSVDHNRYVPSQWDGNLEFFYLLSTPIAYITNPIMQDPFTKENPGLSGWTQSGTLRYGGADSWGKVAWVRNADGTMSPRGTQELTRTRVEWYALISHGPDRKRAFQDSSASQSGSLLPFFTTDVLFDGSTHMSQYTPPKNWAVLFIYDATNGTASEGDIMRGGGSPAGRTGYTGQLLYRLTQ
jgi:prepilin-type N-terminal cleavage/methylation domain-containing protein